MAFPSQISTILVVFGTAMWALGSILETQNVAISRWIANISGFSQGRFQEGISVLYAILLVLSGSMFLGASFLMVKTLKYGDASLSAGNIATVSVTMGTGCWAFGSWLATQLGQLGTLFAGSRFTSSTSEKWQTRINKILVFLVSIGISLFLLGGAALIIL